MKDKTSKRAFKNQTKWEKLEDIMYIFKDAQKKTGPIGERGVNIQNIQYYGNYNS